MGIASAPPSSASLPSGLAIRVQRRRPVFGRLSQGSWPVNQGKLYRHGFRLHLSAPCSLLDPPNRRSTIPSRSPRQPINVVEAPSVANVHAPRSTIGGAYGSSRLLKKSIWPIAPLSPWQNAHAERLIGPLRRECFDHVVVLGDGSPPGAPSIHRLLQRSADPSILEQGCPGTATHSGRWTYPCEPNSRRVTPSLCSDLISEGTAVEELLSRPNKTA